MATVRWHGQTFNATSIEQNPDGTWRMIANAHGARFVSGCEITVSPNEIVEMAAAEIPEPTLDQIEAAMAEERTKIESASSILARYQAAAAEKRKKEEAA